jgi:hypothetical protein
MLALALISRPASMSPVDKDVVVDGSIQFMAITHVIYFYIAVVIANTTSIRVSFSEYKTENLIWIGVCTHSTSRSCTFNFSDRCGRVPAGIGAAQPMV